MSEIVLDSGGLIALERNDRAMWAAVKLTVLRGSKVIVPSTALAQVWRASPGQAMLAKALAHCFIAPFDTVAKAVGELCGRSHTADICDAHVALVASRQADILYTSDPSDLLRLLRVCGRKVPTVVLC